MPGSFCFGMWFIFSLSLSFFVFCCKDLFCLLTTYPLKNHLLNFFTFEKMNEKIHLHLPLRASVLFCAGTLLDQLIFKLHDAKWSPTGGQFSTHMLHQSALSTSAALSSTEDGFEVTPSADRVKWPYFCDFWSPKIMWLLTFNEHYCLVYGKTYLTCCLCVL